MNSRARTSEGLGLSVEGAAAAASGGYLVWEDITVEVMAAHNYIRNVESRKLLGGITGFAAPERIMAIMGPSGSGKSTLLDALAGRLAPTVTMRGNILLNGKHRSMGCRSVSYVTQEDVLLGTLTVRETLTYSAHLRLPSTMTKDEIDEVVESTILKMGLQVCADNKIGNWHIRGISGGEKRRLSISLELLTQPYLMFLDEPTTGLDSASALFVVRTLKEISLDGRIVVCAIHQPSSYVFDLFDDLCLLTGGETVYFGEAKMAVKFFAEAGFACPTRRNPADHFLQCINSDFDKIIAVLLRTTRNDSVAMEFSQCRTNPCTEDNKAILLEKFKKSEYSVNARRRIREIKLASEDVASGSGRSTSSSTRKWKQLRILISRSFTNMVRDAGYYWLRILFNTLVALGAGILYYDIGLSSSAFLDRLKCYTFLYDFLLCLSVGGLPSFFEEWKVSHHERLNGHYGEAIFVLSNYLSSFPFLVIICVTSGTIVYSMVKFHLGFYHYAYLCINFLCCTSIMETITMIVALLVPNFMMGIGVSSAAIVLLSLASGLYRPLPKLPQFFWRYPMSYISFSSWAVNGQLKNDMVGLEFETSEPGQPKIKGEIVIQTLLGVEVDKSKWWDIAVLMLLFFCHKLLFFVLLKYKGNVSFLLRKVYARRSLYNLPSFRKECFSSSRRQHPLSSQEGLESPLS